MLGTAAGLLTLAALFSYLTVRYTRFPNSVGVMAIAMLSSLAFVILGHLGFAAGEEYIGALVRHVDLSQVLLAGLLGYLLFAGALHVDLSEVLTNKLEITLFATLGVILSTILVGYGTFYLLKVLGIGIPLLYCFLFGALISPTDPVAVLAILRSVRAPRRIQVGISGEALFNDGVGVVLFLLISHAIAGSNASLGSITGLFFLETLGGIAFGFFAGFLAHVFLKSAHDRKVELLITLALVTGTYALALQLSLSGAVAVVVAGLIIGNHGYLFPLFMETRASLYGFWGLMDDLLKALLFLLIGFEVLAIPLVAAYLWAGVGAVVIVLLARAVSVFFLDGLLRGVGKSFGHGAVRIMTWGGIRGGIPVALALATPLGPEHNLIVAITYVVVAFSIIVQGTTIQSFARRLYTYTG